MVRRTKFRSFSGGLHLKKVSWGKGFLRLMMLAALIATLGLVTPPVAPVSAGDAPWYETSGWQYRQEITIDHSRVGIMSALVSNADAGAFSIYVEDCSLFSKYDIVLLEDDSNSEELEVFATVGSSQVKLDEPLVKSYTVDAHACLKNVSNPGADLIDFPVLVQITDQDNDIFGHAQEDGDDILFTEDDGITKLDHEIDWYNDDSGELELDAWVRVPSISASADTILYMYYGSSYSGQESSAVWSEDYVMVQHLQETERGGGDFDDHLDSTSNDNDGELFAGNSIWGVNITIEEYDEEHYLGHHPININEYPYPEPAVFVIGLVTKWSYDYYDEDIDWTIDYENGMFKALADGGIPLGKDCNVCYSYSCANDGPTMTATGKIAGADFFDGIDDAIDFYKTEDGGVWNISEAITIQAWVNLQWRPRIGPWEMDNPDYAIISSGTGYEMCLWTDIEGDPPDPTDLVPDEWFQIDGVQYDCCPPTQYPNIPVLPDIDEWYLLTGVYDGAELYSYVNAALDYSTSASGLIDGEPDDGLFVGMCSDLDAPVFGIIDEVRILKESRDGEWVRACYNNQALPSVFCSLGAEEEEGVTPTLMEGDVTLDKHVSMTDAMFVAQWYVGLRTLDADQLKCADTFDDGSVGMSDAMHIAQWYVDPTGGLGVLKVPLWESPGDDDMLHPVA